MLLSTIALMTQALGAEQREGQEAQPRTQWPKAPSIGKTMEWKKNKALRTPNYINSKESATQQDTL